MTIYKGSRYETVPIYRQVIEVGTSFKVVPTLRRRLTPEISTKEALVHVFIQGDRIDLLAYKYYGDSQLWWAILDANLQFMTPWDIPIGTILLIPPLNAIRNGGV